MNNNIERIKRYTLGEEVFNAVSHGVGAVLSIAGLVIMVVLSSIYGNGYAIASSIVYGLALIILYTMSTLYHSLTKERVKAFFRVLDHCTIYLLIAGSYTPLALISLNGTTGWVIFGVIWSAAAVGILINAIDVDRFRIISLISYIAMGWVAVFTLRPMIEVIRPGGIILLLAGGVMYTAGMIFYVMKKHRYMHSIWHLFVLCGSILHFFCILLYVLPITYN